MGVPKAVPGQKLLDRHICWPPLVSLVIERAVKASLAFALTEIEADLSLVDITLIDFDCLRD